MIQRTVGLFVCSILAISSTVQAAPDAKKYEAIVGNAIAFLETSQADDGSFSSHVGPSVTALVATGLMKQGRSLQDPMVSKAVDYVVSHGKPDGGVYMEGTRYRNYETCLAIMCLTEAKKRLPEGDTRYDEVIAGAEKFVRNLQWDQGEGHGPESMNYGGAGYGSHGRPDLSNTSFLIEALESLGAGPDDPAMERALVFVSRTQNLETEYNTSPFAAKVDDGGFYYTPAAGGQSQAGETENGGLRSYASMTYAGLKSMLYAGVGPDDPRVKAAYDWARKHYSLEKNPGMGLAGLYYYYQTFAKALDAMEVGMLVDAQGVAHDWRKELVEKLAAEQNEDGSWTNENDRWLESDPNLVVGYCLLALSHCKQ